MSSFKLKRDDLVGIISKWSLEDILNDDLIKEQIKKISKTFVSLAHYFESFRYPFIEEMRAELASCLNKITDAPCFDVCIEEDHESYIKLRWSKGDERVYTPKSGDILLLSTVVPKNVLELKNGRAFSCLAFVTDVGSLEERCLKVKLGETAGARIKSRVISFAAVFLLSTANKSRIWNSMNVDADDRNLNLNLIKKTLHGHGLVQKSCSCSIQNEFSVKKDLLKNLEPKVLNNSQVTAISKVLSTMRCSHTYSIGRIYGFPGTGKTEIIAIVSWIALQMKQMQCKVIVCAPTTFSVLEVVSRVLKLVPQNICNAFDGRWTGLSLSDIVVLGKHNNKNLDTFQEFSAVCLEDILVLVEPYFSVSSGWKQCMTLLVDTLDNVLSKDGEQDDFSMEILKEKINSAALSVKNCILLLLRYLPRSLLSNVETQNLSSLLSSIDFMLKFLCDNFVKMHQREFCKLRSACVDVIEMLRIPETADKKSIEHLFLEHACIIFCPSSDITKLHSLGGSWGSGLLIVDRASEVKECESLPLLQLDGLRHAILLGGNTYKPAVIKSKNLVQTGYGRSLFERLGLLSHAECNLDMISHAECNLDMQYRMHPAISHFPKKFFMHKLLDSPLTVDSGITIPLLPECISEPYSFLDVSDGREMIDEQNQEPKNLLEAAIVCKIVLKCLRASASSGKQLSIGVISHSAAQVRTIDTMLKDKVDLTNNFLFWVKTINELESSEVDVIVISTVCSCHRSCLGLLSDNQIAQFCLTKARKFLWIVGNGEMLKRSSSVWREVVLDAEERGCFYVASRDKFLADTVINVKNEIKQLDAILNQGGAHFNGTRWKVQISNDFKKSFVGIRCNLTKQIVVAFLWRLACGWRPKRKRLYFSKFIKQFKVHGFTLVCTTDIVKEDHFIQVMRVWDVLTLVEIPKLLQRLHCMMSSFGDGYIDYCKTEMLEGDLIVPMSWENLPESFFYEEPFRHGSCSQSRMESFVNDMRKGQNIEGLMLMKFYSLSSGNSKHLVTASDGQEIDLPFEVSDLESKIISFPDSAFILGRSGTGKTLVLLTKLVQREQQYFLALRGSSKLELEFPFGLDCSEEYDGSATEDHALCQVFLTVNPNLSCAVNGYIARLRRYTLGGEVPEEFKAVEAYNDTDELKFSEIPNSFIEIPHCLFPLVVSLHKLLVMLDGSLKDSFFDSFSDIKVISDGKKRGSLQVLQHLIKNKEVDYDRFLSFYWPRFDINLTKRLEPSLVFSQIIYCIKGEIGCQKTHIYGSLEKEEYIDLCNKRGSLIGKVTREMIYKIFISYEKRKKGSGEYDISDLVNDLHRRLSIYDYEGRKLDYMYIDEVQDFSMKQICLLKYICPNFQSGFQFAGDTAQTLANDFRFQDIKCWFYKEFLSGASCASNYFELTTNFRTHSGVLELAESVLNLLYHFFPDSVDRLASEKSDLHGNFPVILESVNDEDVLQTIFGNYQTSEEFGAEQVILVRHVHDKEKVIKHIGSKAIVLTIKECKGLEFEDVLLYNFFSESPLKNHWRVVYKYMDHNKIVGPGSSMTFPNSDTDPILCHELKQLYVALTRTKKRLWISEANNIIAKPIFDYWEALSVIQVQRLTFPFIREMFVNCKKEDWKSRGKKFFNEGNYGMAIQCFKKSGEVYMENWAKAALLQSEGSLKFHTNFKVAIESLLNAADIYLSIGKAELAAACFVKAKEYEKAGTLYLENFHEPKFEDAGDCFALAGRWTWAAKVYAQGKCLSKCLSACREGLRFDLGFDFLKKWPLHVSSSDWIDYAKSTIAGYCKLKSIDSLWKLVRAFPNDLINLLLKSENFREAAAVSRLQGDVLLEVVILQKAKFYYDSSNLMLSYVVGKMLWTDGNKGWPLKRLRQLKYILEEAKLVATSACTDVKNSICAEANFLLDECNDVSALAMHIGNAKPSDNICIKFFASRCILEICLRTKDSGFSQDLDLSLNQQRGEVVQSMLSKGYVSLQVLMFAWNLWKEIIHGLLSHIQSYGTPEVSKYTKYGEFCMKYFGALKLDIKGVYVSSNSSASWMNCEGRRDAYAVENFSYVSDSVFNSLAKTHCLSEIISVGESLLQKLEALHKCFSSHEFSTDISIIKRGVISHQFFMVLNFLKKHGYSRTCFQFAKLDESLSQFHSFLFQTYFPLEFNTALKQLEYSMQDTTTLTTIIYSKNVSPIFDDFDPVKTARVLVFLLARRLEGKLYLRTFEFLRGNFTWRNFFHQLTYFKSTGCTTPLVEKFLALSNLDLQSQLALLENVLFYTLLCDAGKGWFITSRSCLSTFSKKCMSYLDLFATVDIQSLEDVRKSSSSTYDFVLAAAEELLHRATKCRVKALNFFRLLVQRLVIMMSIVCLNSPNHFLKVKEMLREADGILLGLPHKFLLNFWHVRNCRLWPLKFFGVAFSSAMKSVGDQLAVVSLDDCNQSFDHLTPWYVKRCSVLKV